MLYSLLKQPTPSDEKYTDCIKSITKVGGKGRGLVSLLSINASDRKNLSSSFSFIGFSYCCAALEIAVLFLECSNVTPLLVTRTKYSHMHAQARPTRQTTHTATALLAIPIWRCGNTVCRSSISFNHTCHACTRARRLYAHCNLYCRIASVFSL